MKTKRTLLFFSLAFSLIFLSCARPVLHKNYLIEGDRNVSFAALREYPDQFKGKLFIFGGVMVQTRLLNVGSEIEAMHVPVDHSGYFEESGRSEGRFLAILPKGEGMLDPAIFRRGRRITLAAEFTGIINGKIDEMEYAYPDFRIKQIYLWPKEQSYYYAPPYYYDPWFYPFPYYYWGPWWSWHYYRYPVPVAPHVNRRSPPPSNQPPVQRREPKTERAR
jgi:outer membrane lipoprotein